MIQANELRIGNLVQRPEVIKHPALDGGFIYFLVNDTMIRDCVHYKDNWAFEGIPLSPEILEKCGLVSTGTGNLCLPDFGSEWEVCKMTYGYVICHESSDQRLWNIPIDYLHQFQNAIFILTGRELTVNL